MNVRIIQPSMLDTVWSEVEPLLEQAITHSAEESTVCQARLNIINGNIQLAVITDGDTIKGACTYAFVQYANFKACHIFALGGKGILRDMNYLDEWKEYIKSQGCSKIETNCRQSMMRLAYKTMGMEEVYTTIRGDL